MFISTPIFIDYQRKANTQRDLVLGNINSHGFWDKKNPFKGESYNSKSEVNKKIVVITRATLRWNRLLSFWNAVPRASKAIKNAKGVLYYKGIGEWPFIQQATISIWDNFKSINDFAYKDKIHSDIVKVTRKKSGIKRIFSQDSILYLTQLKINVVKKIAIIGSGVAGLASGVRLALKGYRVHIFEQNKYQEESYRLLNLKVIVLMLALLYLQCHILLQNSLN